MRAIVYILVPSRRRPFPYINFLRTEQGLSACFAPFSNSPLLQKMAIEQKTSSICTCTICALIISIDHTYPSQLRRFRRHYWIMRRCSLPPTSQEFGDTLGSFSRNRIWNQRRHSTTRGASEHFGNPLSISLSTETAWIGWPESRGSARGGGSGAEILHLLCDVCLWKQTEVCYFFANFFGI